jgi:hypothetical protein
VHDVNILDEIMPEAGAFYVMDRAYIDFQRLFVFTLSSAFFLVRTKSNVLLQRRYSHPVDKSTRGTADMRSAASPSLSFGDRAVSTQGDCGCLLTKTRAGRTCLGFAAMQIGGTR